MKLIKNRFIALCLAVLIVIFSSLLSVHIKLNNEFSLVRDDFYNGVLIDGQRDISIHSQLTVIGRLAEDIAAVAERNGLNVDQFKDSIDYFSYDVLTMHENISYIHYLYEEMLDDIMETGYALNELELSENDELAVVNALEGIIVAKDNIEGSAYNERIRSYINSLRFPMNVWADISGASLPEYFA